MAFADLGGLDLRLGGPGRVDTAPDIDAFARRPVRPAPEEPRVGVLPGRRPLDAREPLRIFFRHAGYGIPVPGAPRVATPRVSSWSMCPTTFGYLATVTPPGRGRRASAAWVVAACIPLAFPSLAAAAPAKEPIPVQRPGGETSIPEPGGGPAKGTSSKTSDKKSPAPSVAPDPDDDATDDEDVDPPSLPDDDDDDDDTLAESETDDLLVSTEPPPAPSAETSRLDAAWEGVIGYDVDLELKGGREMRGVVGAVQAETFTLIQSETGAILVLPKSGVVSLRAHMPPPLPDKTGTGLLVGGGILTGLGGPVFLSGIVILAVCPSCATVHLPLLIIGAGTLGGGIPMLIGGSRRQSAYRKAVEERALSPVVMKTPGGWTGGLRFRF